MINTEYHVNKFRKQIDEWKEENIYESDDDSDDPDSTETCFSLYHSNADQILADMEEFIVFVNTH